MQLLFFDTGSHEVFEFNSSSYSLLSNSTIKGVDIVKYQVIIDAAHNYNREHSSSMKSP